jgi:hypothetical protein
MDQHNYQKARLKLFEDKKINEVWLYPKNGDRPFHLPASKITVETDFQRPNLESFQGKVETRAAPAFLKVGKWDKEDYAAITEWVVLHLIRNRKSRREFFSSPEDYNDRFIPEFYNELAISRHRYPNVDVHESKDGHFLVTSDHPVVELQVPGESDYVRCFAKSPDFLILYSARKKPPQFEIPVEDYFNAMVYALADQFVFSHRNDANIQTLKKIANEFQMWPEVGQ